MFKQKLFNVRKGERGCHGHLLVEGCGIGIMGCHLFISRGNLFDCADGGRCSMSLVLARGKGSFLFSFCIPARGMSSLPAARGEGSFSFSFCIPARGKCSSLLSFCIPARGKDCLLARGKGCGWSSSGGMDFKIL